jgi:hypothetical protein
MISLIYSRRALPIYWTILNKKGASNLQEQKALIRPVIKLLNKYHIMIIGDREFHSIELATYLSPEFGVRSSEFFLDFFRDSYQNSDNNIDKNI